MPKKYKKRKPRKKINKSIYKSNINKLHVKVNVNTGGSIPSGISYMHAPAYPNLMVVGMFPNIPVKKTLSIVKEELHNDENLKSRTKWEVEDISKLLEISIETYFKTLDGKYISRRIDCRLENPFQNLWLEFICTGLRKLIYSMKTAVSKKT